MSALAAAPARPAAGEARARRRLGLLVVSHRWPPYARGGYELRSSDLVRALRDRGHRVGVLCGMGAELEESEELLPWLEPRLDGGQDLFERSDRAGNLERARLHVYRHTNYLAAARALERSGADLLLYHNLTMASLAPILAARHAGVPVLGDVSDPWPLNHWILAWRARLEREGRARPLRLALLEGGWSSFRSLVGLGPMLVPSRFLARELAADGVPETDLEVLPTAASGELFPVRDGETPRRASEPLRVLSTSSLWEGKGVHVLLEALARAATQAPLEAVVAGEGAPEYAQRLRALAAAPALEGRVRFAGRLGREAVRAELDRTHVLVLPSVWGEPYSRAPLEARARGACVVASDAGASPEQVEDGRDGLLVPAGDAGALAAALVQLAGDEGLRRRLVRAGLERARREGDFGRYVERVEDAILRAAGVPVS